MADPSEEPHPHADVPRGVAYADLVELGEPDGTITVDGKPFAYWSADSIANVKAKDGDDDVPF